MDNQNTVTRKETPKRNVEDEQDGGSVYAGKIFTDKLYTPHLTVLERVLLLDSRDVNLTSKIPDAVLHRACTVLSWPNAEN